MGIGMTFRPLALMLALVLGLVALVFSHVMRRNRDANTDETKEA